MKTATKRTTASAGKRRLQNTVRRSRGKKTVTRIVDIATEALEALYDETLTLPDCAYAFQSIVSMGKSLDARRAPQDPSKGGKAL